MENSKLEKAAFEILKQDNVYFEKIIKVKVRSTLVSSNPSTYLEVELNNELQAEIDYTKARIEYEKKSAIFKFFNKVVRPQSKVIVEISEIRLITYLLEKVV